MSDIRLTPSQARAVSYRGGPVLVSAAAGSGKTRVLTERLMDRVAGGEDIDRFLVITFTRAAAAELRGRILTELNARIAADPANRRWRRQSALLYRTQIGTIDSFCQTLVRENAHILGISPGFVMLAEDRAQAMQIKALEDVLDRAYEDIGQNPGLKALVDSVGAGRDDSRLADLILDLDKKLQSQAFPDRWVSEKLRELDVSGMTDASETVWGRYILNDAAKEAAYRAGEIERALAFMAQPGHELLMNGYGPSFEKLGQIFRDTARAAAQSWDQARDAAAQPTPRLGIVRGFEDEAAKAKVKGIWDAARKAADKLRKTTLAGESAVLLNGVAASRPALEALTDLVFKLEKEYAARKRRADGLDFSDAEHMCVKLLCSPDGGPTALAGTVSGRFAEVMVDEYQDVNAVQELIFRRVSQEGQNLFMVGDVKQSVYRFRLADPSIFNRKYDTFGPGGQGERILLRENFRSRAAVLAACNTVFERVMSPALGGVVYDSGARLIPAASYPALGEIKPELCVLDPADADSDGELPGKTRQEARYVAQRIRSMVEGKELISDGAGGMRPVTYGDIAVLLRTPGTSGKVYRQALTDAGVPVDARQGGAFFTQPEVNFAISMLTVADNPRQDVPLIAALRGLPYGFTPNELAAIRAEAKGELWDALVLRAEHNKRCADFVYTVRHLRSLARETATDMLLRQLYDHTGLLTVCAVMPDAAARTADLMQLYEYARQFEADGGRGLFRFVGWLRELERRGLEPPAPAGDAAVQLMSIHKSKGLEFPVVFLADNGHRWNLQGSAQVVCHAELGLGMKMTDPIRGVSWPTLPWRAISLAERREDLSEQVRVLYVAMTRARERLVMTCIQNNAAEKLDALADPTALDERVLSAAQSPAPWLMAAAAADGGRTITVRTVSAAASPAPARTEPAPLPEADPADVAVLEKRLSWRYPYETAVTLPSKLTATAARDMADGEAAALPVPRPAIGHLRMPDLGRAKAPLTGTERGVAAHLVMQYIDLHRTGSAEDVKKEIARLRFLGFLNDRQAEAVDAEDILAFFRSELGLRLLAADKVIREFRFSLLCPARRWYPQAPPEENVLLQGVVDCCIEEEGQLTVIDFKTDSHVEPERYTGQLLTYALAMERIFQKPVRQTVLWYLRKRVAANCPLPAEK